MIISQTKDLLELFIAMSSEKDGDILLERLLTAALDITHCDGGTLYILNENKLEFKFMITRSQNVKKGGKNEKITLPAVKLERTNVCAYSILENKVVNIPDVYSSDLFDFSGPQQYDKLTNYKTKSMIVIPMEDDKGNIIGVLQLLNAHDKNGNIISFNKEKEMILTAIASQAAIRLTNMNYMQEIENLMDSLVQTFAEVISLRTPYNVSHTHNMAKYAKNFLAYLLENPSDYIAFNEEDAKLFIMSIWLHDIGKLITPLDVMDKETRLGTKHERVMTRLEIISLNIKLNSLKTNIDPTDMLCEIERVRQFINVVNTLPYLNAQTLSEVQLLSQKQYQDENGSLQNWFTEDEIEDLSIVKGTLNTAEIDTMRKHVVMTAQILEKMNFKNNYKKVSKWANNHHELLNGSGYPNQLRGDDIDVQTRLLTIIDIFDALSAKDRPYKKQLSIDTVFEIMQTMQTDGKIDATLLCMFKASRAWL